MLLRCTQEARDCFLSRYPGYEPYPFLAGEVYDVAEIFEHPYHIMARVPGEPSWPGPGDPMFDWHAEDVFEPTDQPIEIVSCGYFYQDYVTDFFGVIIDDPADVARLDLVYNLECEYESSDLGDFTSWRARFASTIPEWLARAWFDLEVSGEPKPDLAIHKRVFYPKDLKCPFASVGFHAPYLVRKDISNSQARRLIKAFLEPLRIRVPEPRLLDVEFWMGNGSPRLIHPKSNTD